MPSTVITESELLDQSAELLEAAFSVMARVSFDLRAGAFDDEPGARAQAESLIADAKRSYAELLREAWPEPITTLP